MSGRSGEDGIERWGSKGGKGGRERWRCRTQNSKETFPCVFRCHAILSKDSPASLAMYTRSKLSLSLVSNSTPSVLEVVI